VNDPTYVKEDIDRIPAWKLAFFLSEIDNDNAPIGWGRYIQMAEFLLRKYKIEEK